MTVTVQYSIDEEMKKEYEATCKQMGLKPSAVFQLFAATVIREKKIPFEIKANMSNESEE